MSTVATRHSPLAVFISAIAAGDDERTELLALQLTSVDEPYLIDMTGAADVDVRWWAVRGLAVAGSSMASPPLQGCLADADSSVRAAAALALAHLHAREPAAVREALSAVAACLADDEGMVRQAAADCLALCGDDAVPALAGVLRDGQHEGARTRAAAALRKIATMKAAAALYPALNDPNHLVRMYAYEALDEMGLLENVLVVL